MLTVRSHSNSLIIVGDTYLFPGQSRRVPDAVAQAAIANNPGALVILEEVVEVAEVEAQPVAVKPAKRTRKAKG